MRRTPFHGSKFCSVRTVTAIVTNDRFKPFNLRNYFPRVSSPFSRRRFASFMLVPIRHNFRVIVLTSIVPISW